MFVDNVNNLTRKVEELRTNRDKKYQDWTLDEILDWVKTLDDGNFTKYCSLLETNFENDIVKGSDLPFVFGKFELVRPVGVVCQRQALLFCLLCNLSGFGLVQCGLHSCFAFSFWSVVSFYLFRFLSHLAIIIYFTNTRPVKRALAEIH